VSTAGIVDGLRRAGLIGKDHPVFEPLAGGVSCDVWKVDTPGGPIVVKQPLGKLRVEADWEAPVERSENEVRWLQRARSVNPHFAPEVLAEFRTEHAFVLRYLDNCPVWKDELTTGRVDMDFAAAVGRSIGSVHAATADSPIDQGAFPSAEMFHALRVEPFILHVARTDIELAPTLKAIADDLVSRRIALVHGDVSPKNILVGPDGPVFLDAECAVYGDPAFDLAFCTTHLLLKAVWLGDTRMQEAATALILAYRDSITWEDAAGLLQRAGRLAAALLLARVDGKSPAPYLTDPAHRAIVRDQARALLLSATTIDAVVAGWKKVST
jgi:aminoglycoside phosphotransferase (APT) family kinase protein